MMKYLNITLVVVLALSFTIKAKAEFADPVIFPTKIRVSIIGHTGQDPVNRSFAEELDISIPTLKSKFVQQILKSEFSPALVSGVTKLNDWPRRFTPIHDSEFNQQLYIINELERLPHDSQSILHSFPSNNIPAPPAFLLMLAGLVTRSRRKS